MGWRARLRNSGRGAAWLARLLGVQEVRGSNPRGPTKTLQTFTGTRVAPALTLESICSPNGVWYLCGLCCRWLPRQGLCFHACGIHGTQRSHEFVVVWWRRQHDVPYIGATSTGTRDVRHCPRKGMGRLCMLGMLSCRTCDVGPSRTHTTQRY